MEHAVTSPPPAVTVVEISDLSAAMAGIELMQMDGVHLQSMPLRARRVIVRLDSAAITARAALWRDRIA